MILRYDPAYLTCRLGFEKYFRVVVRGLSEGEDYYRNQYCKFFLLYSVSLPTNLHSISDRTTLTKPKRKTTFTKTSQTNSNPLTTVRLEHYMCRQVRHAV